MAEVVAQELQEVGLIKFKTKHVLQKLLAMQVEGLKFRRTDITRVLKQQYHMHYSHLSETNYIRKNRELAERRGWVCKVLVKMLLEGALVMSFDESPLRVEFSKGRQWVPDKLKEARHDWSITKLEGDLAEVVVPESKAHKQLSLLAVVS